MDCRRNRQGINNWIMNEYLQQFSNIRKYCVSITFPWIVTYLQMFFVLDIGDNSRIVFSFFFALF